MSEPLSLREARTKRQKADVYKTSRSEFRSTLNPTRNDSPDSLDDTENRRKIKKVDEKGTGEESKGEGSATINVLKKDKKTKHVPRDDDSNYDFEDEDDIATDDEESDQNSTDDKNNDKKGKQDKKKDDESDNNGGEDNMNMKEGKGDDAKDKDKPNESDQNEKNNKDDKHQDESTEDNDETKNEDDDDKKNYQEDTSPVANDDGEHKVETVDNVTDEEEAAIQKEEQKKYPNFNSIEEINEMYEAEYEIDEYDSDQEDRYEFLSQDGGSRGGSENSYGGEEDYNNDEETEVRSAG